MTWNYSLGRIDLILSAVYVVLYGIYCFRIFRTSGTAQSLKSLIPKLALRGLALFLIFVALAGPFFGKPPVQPAGMEKNLYFLIDLSRSMDANDVAPSRLEKVKFEIGKLLNDLDNSRVGLIVFSNEAHVLSPLTNDRDALRFYVQALQTSLLPRHGSDICGALTFALNKIDTENASKIARTLVLITDGEGNSGCSIDIFNRLRLAGVALYVVGVGTEAGANIMTNNGKILDRSGNPVVSSLNSPAINKLVSSANGSLFRLNNQSNDFAALELSFTNQPGVYVDSATSAVSTNRFEIFLLGALILMILDILITVRTFKI